MATIPSTIEAFIDQLHAADDAEQRRALLLAPPLPPAQLHELGQRLLAEAISLHGADLPRMERLCRDLLTLAEGTADPVLAATATMHLGDALRAQAKHVEACALYDAAADRFAALRLPVHAARTRIGWIDAVVHLGRAADALAGARRARRVFREHGETLLLARLDLVVGNVYGTQGLHRPALRCFSAAFAAAASAGDAGALVAAMCRHNRGLVLTRLGRHREALAELDLAQSAYEQMGRAVNAARVVRSRGEVHLALGHYSAALQTFEQVTALFAQLGLASRPEVLSLACDTANCYLALNRPADALAVLAGRAEGEAARQNVQHAIAVVIHLVATYLRLGRERDALTELEAADRHLVDASLQHRAWLAAQRGRVLLSQGAFYEALATTRDARTLARAAGSRQLETDALRTQGAAFLALGLTAEATTAAAGAYRLARLVNAAPLLQQTHELLGQIAETTTKVAVARRHYLAAAEQLEREEQGVIFDFRESFSQNRGLAYERLAQLQLETNQPTEALLTVERAKSRALVDALTRFSDPHPRGSSALRQLKRRLTRARADYAAHCARLSYDERQITPSDLTRRSALEEQIAHLRQRLQVSGASTADDDLDLYGVSPTTSLPELAQGSCLLEFFVSGQDLVRFMVDEGGVRGVLLPAALPEVERLVRAFRLSLQVAEKTERGELPRLVPRAQLLLQRLYRILFAGLDDLDAYRTLVIVPHGILHYLPFHALHDGERYLIEQLAVVYAPSATIYNLCRRHRTGRRGRSAVLACSAGGQLPHVAREADAVSALLGTVALHERAATRAALRTAGRRAGVIHIAAHGTFRADAPLFSTIELADGPLTTADVFALDLSAALVTLSACDTGHASVGSGDELVGIARAFLYAGAPALLVSQWRVDDASTATLMTRFYTALRQGMSKAEALRTAQLAALVGEVPQNEPTHPFIWAAFQLVGDDRPVPWGPQRGPRREQRSPHDERDKHQQ